MGIAWSWADSSTIGRWVMCCAYSLLALGRFLQGFLLPIFFGGIDGDYDQQKSAARLLGRSFRFLIFAVVFRFLMSATELMLNLGGNLRMQG
jgi:hypothetical protein